MSYHTYPPPPPPPPPGPTPPGPTPPGPNPPSPSPGSLSSAISVEVPFPVFYDRAGEPLENGYIFIGQANLNPQTNPIQVFFDRNLTQLAAQPLRTLAGYISNAGTPAQVFVDATNFSIQVQDKNGTLVYNFPDGTGLASDASGIDYTPGPDSLLLPGGTISIKSALDQITDKDDGSSLIGFTQPDAGSVSKTVQSKLRQFVNVSDFGAIGDGVTDDTGALTNFVNSAINNPGVPHRLNKATYCISAVMPTINISNVIIEGEGADIHDIGALITGTVLKWIGASATVGPMIKISAISGPTNQRVADVKFTGIGLDCNSGAIDYGIELISIRDSQIDVAITNAGFAGMQIEVVAQLGEAKDTQRCQIHLLSRQIEKRNAFCLVCGGDAVANVSLNEFWVDAQITDQQAIFLVNSDNNDWNFIRVFRAGGGTAFEGVSCLGGANSMERSRGERFWYYTGTVPIHVYGTSGSPAFAVGSNGHSLFTLDTENGTPSPIQEVGGSISWRKDVSGLSDSYYEPFTPTLSATSGTLTTATAAMLFRRRGNIIFFKSQITITVNGSASGALQMSMPVPQVGSFGTISIGLARAVSGLTLRGFLDGGGATVMNIKTVNDTYPGANGETIELSGFYQVT